MAGSPSQVTRATLGTTLRDRRPVEHPEYEIAADRINLLEHVAVGAGLVGPRVCLIASWGGSSFTISKQEESWNTDHSQAHPTLARSATGVYTYTLASSYLDEDEQAVAPNLLGARISPLVDMTAGYSARKYAWAWVDTGNPLVVQIRIYDAAGSAADAKFWLEAA